MKRSLIILFVLLVSGCSDADVQVVKEDQAEINIQKQCALLQPGMTTSEANKIMAGVTPLKVTRTSGPNSGSGYYLYWNSPSDAKVIIEEPLRGVIPHGETCKANFNSMQEIEETKIDFVSEQAYQEKASIMSE